MLFNHFRYNAFKHKNAYYLLDNMDFSIYEIGQEVFLVLKKEKISINELPENLLFDFIRNAVLIKATS